jgi:hypothetical protein
MMVRHQKQDPHGPDPYPDRPDLYPDQGTKPRLRTLTKAEAEINTEVETKTETLDKTKNKTDFQKDRKPCLVMVYPYK